MLFVQGTVGNLKIRVHSVVEGDMEDAKSTAHVLAAHGINDVAVMSGELAGGNETGRAVYVVERDGYGHHVALDGTDPSPSLRREVLQLLGSSRSAMGAA